MVCSQKAMPWLRISQIIFQAPLISDKFYCGGRNNNQSVQDLFCRTFAYCMWLPPQNGLFPDLPQWHNVTRFLVSYFLPSCDSICTPPFTQNGPRNFSPCHFVWLIDGSNPGSIGLLRSEEHT